jgi:hypothetical protein
VTDVKSWPGAVNAARPAGSLEVLSKSGEAMELMVNWVGVVEAVRSSGFSRSVR